MNGGWLWDAGPRLGMADSPEEAQRDATEQLEPGMAARVEYASRSLDADLKRSYRRSGIGWTGRRDGDRVRWVPIESEFGRACEEQERAYAEMVDGLSRPVVVPGRDGRRVMRFTFGTYNFEPGGGQDSGQDGRPSPAAHRRG